MATRFVRQGTPTLDLGGVDLTAPGRAVGRHRQDAGGSARAQRRLAAFEQSQHARSHTPGPAEGAAGTGDAADHAAVSRRGRGLSQGRGARPGLRLPERGAAPRPDQRRAARRAGPRVARLGSCSTAACPPRIGPCYYSPQSAEARNTLGTVLWALGQRQQARRAFEDAVALDPRAWYAVRNLCEVALTDGRTKEATMLCHRASALRKGAAETTR